MKSLFLHRVAVATLALLMGATVAHAQAGSESFSATHIADLRSYNELSPPTDSARGILFMRVNFTNRMVRYRISVAGLSGITGAHFHRGTPEENGPVVFSIAGLTDTSLTATGTWSMSQGVADSLIAGLVYVNVHTTAHPSGNIRGQVIQMPNFFSPGMASSQEVGHTVTDTLGFGEALYTVDPATMRLSYIISWGGLSGPATMAHFHLGAFGAKGPPLQSIPLAPGRNGAFGSWTINDTLLAYLKSGGIYLNIHTAKNPEGEIRGQIVPAYAFTAAIAPENEEPSHADSSRGAGSGFAIVATISATPFLAVVGGQAIVGNTTGPVTAAHIHIAPLKTNGPVFQGLSLDTSGHVWEVPDGTTRFASVDTVVIFLSGGAYFNFHTALFPKGEIRGQLIPAATNLLPSVSVPLVDISEDQRGGMRGELRDGRLYFKLDRTADADARIVLYNMLGNEVASVGVEGDGASVSAAGFAPGVYVGRLITNGGGMGACKIMVRP